MDTQLDGMKDQVRLIDERVTVMAMDDKTYKDETSMIIVMRTDIPIRRGDKISH